EEGLELVTRAGVIEDGLRPPLPRTQYIAVGEAAARGDAMEVMQRDAARDDVAHMDIDGGKAGSIEGRGHLYLAVDPLLAQDRNLGTRAGRDEGRSDVVV